MIKHYLFWFLLTFSSFSLRVAPVYSQTTDETCNSALNYVSKQIAKYGTSVNVISFDDANSYHLGNPSNRKTRILFILGKILAPIDNTLISINYNYSKSNDVAQRLLSSVKLQQEWANYLVKNCHDLAVIGFGQAHTDWINEYGIQTNGLTKKRECLDTESESGEFLPWNYQFCL
jgi:hypothetical protein